MMNHNEHDGHKEKLNLCVLSVLRGEIDQLQVLNLLQSISYFRTL
jgi:hypothetical protein